jgi:hypothetical protein
MVAGTSFGVSPAVQPGDEILPVAYSTAVASFGAFPMPPPEIVSRAKHLVKELEYHALAVQACCPREDIYTFINLSRLDVSVPEWAGIANRLANWILLGSGTSAHGLIAHGHDPAAVYAAAKAAEACFVHVVAVGVKVSELLLHGDSVLYVHPRIAWYIIATGIVDMVLYVLGSEEQSVLALARIGVLQRWLDQMSVRQSWPSMDTYRFGFAHFYGQAMAFRESWVAANGASPPN